MKHIFTLVLFFTAFTASAQFKFGVKAGANLVRVKFADHQSTISYKPAFYTGAFTNYRLTKKFSVQSDILGFAEFIEVKQPKTNITNTVTKFFLRVPLMIQYGIAPGLRVATGPQMAVGIKQGKKPDWRWALVAGYQMPFLKSFSVNARYSLSMFNKKNAVGVVQKNQVFQMGVCYALTFKTKK